MQLFLHKFSKKFYLNQNFIIFMQNLCKNTEFYALHPVYSPLLDLKQVLRYK